ncbi:MAG: hypothetical protein MZV70_22400 [Desulfobacterales bacterium]|nr:hypothetical protein [Desulfobacterales bacterium]
MTTFRRRDLLGRGGILPEPASPPGLYRGQAVHGLGAYSPGRLSPDLLRGDGRLGRVCPRYG